MFRPTKKRLKCERRSALVPMWWTFLQDKDLGHKMGIVSKHVLTVTVIDPDTHLQVEVEIRKLDSGLLVGFDECFLSHMEDEDRIRNPYGPGLIEVPSDENMRPERLTSLVLTSNLGEVHGVLNVPSSLAANLNEAASIAEYYSQQIHAVDADSGFANVASWIRDKNGDDDERPMTSSFVHGSKCSICGGDDHSSQDCTRPFYQ